MTSNSSVSREVFNEMHRLVAMSLCDNMSSADDHRLADLVHQDIETFDLYLNLVFESSILLAWAGYGAPNAAGTVGCARESSQFVEPVSLTSHRVFGEHGYCDKPVNYCPVPTFLSTAYHGTIRYFSQELPFSLLIATLLTGFGLWIASLVYVSSPDKITKNSLLPTKTSFAPTLKVVGKITGMVDCKWADPNTETFHGANVLLGRKYALASGLIEITYDTGAKVILQGPVTYEVESKDSGFLSEGKLTARVEKKEERRTKNEELSSSRSSFLIPHSYFAVRTPTATVTDLGTEFGVEVNKEGITAAHVFQGVIEVQLANDGDSQRGSAIRLAENESVRVERQEGGAHIVVRQAAVNPAGFVRAGQLPKLAEERRLKPFRRWQAYSQELRREPSLLAYYDFQQKPGEPGVLPNVAANGDRSLDGVVENATWTTGRMTGKHAILFNGPSDHVQINLPQKTDDLTLTAWVYVESLANELNSLMMSDGWSQPGQISWQIHSNGRIQLAIFGGGVPDLYYTPVVFDRTRFRRWTHLAVVYDHGAASARFYADGQLIDEVKSSKHVPISIGSASIGHWNPSDHVAPPMVRSFPGRIDELLIFTRALVANDVQHLYEMGKPRQTSHTRDYPKGGITDPATQRP